MSCHSTKKGNGESSVQVVQIGKRPGTCANDRRMQISAVQCRISSLKLKTGGKCMYECRISILKLKRGGKCMYVT
jgi:hypothetical protein